MRGDTSSSDSRARRAFSQNATHPARYRRRPRPRKNIFPASQVILVNYQAYIVDCGIGVAIQGARADVPLPTLRHVFITHQHSDFTYRLTTRTSQTRCGLIALEAQARDASLPAKTCWRSDTLIKLRNMLHAAALRQQQANSGWRLRPGELLRISKIGKWQWGWWESNPHVLADTGF